MKTVFKFALVLAAIAALAVPAMAQDRAGQVTWSGDVNDTTIVTIHGHFVDSHVVRGKDTVNVNIDFNGRLPHMPVQLALSDWTGRGRVEIVRQPNPDNDFTAAVRIYDPQPGRGHYSFTLGWRPVIFGGPFRGAN